MLKEQLTSKVASIILQHVREPKGRLTEISDLCHINRREMNIRGLSRMKFHRLLRLIYALSVALRPDEYYEMTDDILFAIQEFSDKYEYDLLDE